MQVMNEALLIKEAQLFTQYLIGEQADDLTISLYIKAHDKLTIVVSQKERKRLDILLKHPLWIGMVDGALAVKEPASNIRKKIYVLFAILESNPKFAKHFLQHGKANPYSIIVAGIRAIWNTLTGFILLVWI